MSHPVATVLRTTAVLLGCLAIAWPALAQRPHDGRDDNRRGGHDRGAPPAAVRPVAPSAPPSGFARDWHPGNRQDAQPAYRQNFNPAYRQNFNPAYRAEVRPGWRGDARPGYQPDYRPRFQPQYSTRFQPEYRSHFQPEYRPRFGLGFDRGFRPDRDAWRGGAWRHEWHDGRLGWWWVLGSSWYFYPEPIYPYPPYEQSVYAAPYAPLPDAGGWPSPQFWYFCDDPTGYYPYVASCSVPWREVPAYQTQ